MALGPQYGPVTAIQVGEGILAATVGVQHDSAVLIAVWLSLAKILPHGGFARKVHFSGKATHAPRVGDSQASRVRKGSDCLIRPLACGDQIRDSLPRLFGIPQQIAPP